MLKSNLDFEPEPEPESDCNLERIEEMIQVTNDELKKLRLEKKQCIVEKIKYKTERFTLRELQEKIVLENKQDVVEFLDLFVDTSHKVKDVNITRNHVYEALWILVFLYELDDFNKGYKGEIKRQFYKSLEGETSQTFDEVLDGKVNPGSEGGIADIYFEIIETGNKDDKSINKVTCNKRTVPFPYCEKKEVKVYNKYLASVKLYLKDHRKI